MKRLFTNLFFMLISFAAFAQSTITGNVSDGVEALIGATVQIKGTDLGTITDFDGNFTIQDVPTGEQTLIVKYLGYSDVMMVVNIVEGMNTVETIVLQDGGIGLEEVVVTGIVDVVKDRRTPVAVSTISTREIQAKVVGNVEFPEVMKNTPSIYVSNQTGFGDSQMFTRGFNQSNTAFLLNGQPINGMEDGKMYWSNWSGMSDVATAIQVQRGLGSSKLAISSVGGTINILTKTIDNKEGGFVRGMVGNDSYFKGTVAYNSGLKNKWAYSILVDHWQGENKWAEGTKGQGQTYFLSVGYKPTNQHSFNFLVTGAPQNHGNRWSQKLETLENNPKYNQHWNTYNDDFMSERFNYYHKPIINLSWDYDISTKYSLSSVFYASFGRGGGTGPYGNGRIRDDKGRVDFDAIYAHQDTLANKIGSYGSSYARRASVNNHQWFGNVTNFKLKLTDEITANVGADVRFYTGDHFRQLANLYGLDGWNESYRHATRPSDYVVNKTYSVNPWSALFDYASEGDRIAYDYSENINYQGGFAQIEYAVEKATVFAQGAVSNQSYQREGRWADQGKSKEINKIGYNVKGGASFAPNLNHTVFANAGYYSRQPFLDNIFENIRYSNDIIETGVENESVLGFEVGYKYFADNFSGNLNLYHTTWGNRTISSIATNENGTPDDESDDFTQNTIQRGLEQTHMGVEVDLKWEVNEILTLKGFASFGDWRFNKMEKVQVYNDDTGLLLATEDAVDIDGVHTTNAPQSSLGFGAAFKTDKGLTFDVDVNHYSRLYRNEINFDDSVPYLTEDSGTLAPYVLVDLGIGKTIKLSEKNDLILRMNVKNLFDTYYINQTDVYGYLNGNGRTWNASVKYTF